MATEKRTYRDRAEYLIKAVAKRRQKLKELAVEKKGGKCVFCGYNRYVGALDFHHLEGKDFGLSKDGITRAWSKIETELEKCVLVCSNCHREIHAGLLQPSEVIRSGKTG